MRPERGRAPLCPLPNLQITVGPFWIFTQPFRIGAVNRVCEGLARASLQRRKRALLNRPTPTACAVGDPGVGLLLGSAVGRKVGLTP
jgi:hypothetical protein